MIVNLLSLDGIPTLYLHDPLIIPSWKYEGIMKGFQPMSVNNIWITETYMPFYYAINNTELLFAKLEFKLFTKRESPFAKKRYICVL